MKRQAFTIVEMLVSTALILFIMVILSEAFVAAVDSFRTLKSIGDMDTKLRTVATLLRNDLKAGHFYLGPAAGGGDTSETSVSPARKVSAFPPPANPPPPPTTATPSYPGGFFSVYQMCASANVTTTQNLANAIILSPNDLNYGTFLLPGSPPLSPPPPSATNPQLWPLYALVPPPPAAPGLDPSYTATRLLLTPASGLNIPALIVYVGPSYAPGSSTVQLLTNPDNSLRSLPPGVVGVLTKPDNTTVSLSDYTTAFWELAYEGTDADNVRSYRGVYTLPPSFAGQVPQPASVEALHFSVNLTGNGARRENWLSGYMPSQSPLSPRRPPFFQDNYLSQYAEVAYFLRPVRTGSVSRDMTPTDTAGVAAAPLRRFSLYRRQLLVAQNQPPPPPPPPPVLPTYLTDADLLNNTIGYLSPNPILVPNVPTTGVNDPSNYFDISWYPQLVPIGGGQFAYAMHFNTMEDLAVRENRALSFGICNFPQIGGAPPWWFGWATAGPPPTGRQNFPLEPPGMPATQANTFPVLGERGETQLYSGMAGGDLLLTDVVSFSVRCVIGQNSTDVYVPRPFLDVSCTYPLNQRTRAYSGTGPFTYTANPGEGIQGLEIILRVWDQKTNRTRQVTIFQGM